MNRTWRRAVLLAGLLLLVLGGASHPIAAHGEDAGRCRPLADMPDRSNCNEHLVQCLLSPLGDRNSGGKYGYSTCKDCHDRCRGDRRWPDVDGRGKSCQWWNLK